MDKQDTGRCCKECRGTKMSMGIRPCSDAACECHTELAHSSTEKGSWEERFVTACFCTDAAIEHGPHTFSCLYDKTAIKSFIHTEIEKAREEAYKAGRAAERAEILKAYEVITNRPSEGTK